MKSRFDELLPFYVNDTLDESERAWVDTYLREHPKSAAELQWYRTLQDTMTRDAPAVSAEVGLDKVMARIRAERAPSRPAVRQSPSLGERLREFFSSITPQPLLKPALAGALAVVLVQGIVIANLTNAPDDSSEIRSKQPTNVTDPGPFLKVNFKADAREADIRMLLVEVDGTLAGGPGQLGDWYVRIPEARISAVADKIKTSSIVDGVARVDALPVRP